jgi:hypothetical protein
MSSELPAPLPQEQVCELLNRWAAGGYYRLRNMGDKIFIREIVGGWAYTVRLQTHYEQRSVTHAQEPYLGGPVDDAGRPPDPWNIPVRNPGEFRERTESLPVPHTERVGGCTTCGGTGRVTCPICAGTGVTPCPLCGGSGVRQLQVTETGRGPQGEAVPVVRAVTHACTCGNGQIRCLRCSGERQLVCSDCRGSGKVKTFDRLVVKFLSSRKSDLFDVTPVPDGWFGRLSGESLVDVRQERVDDFAPVNAEVDSRARALLKRSHEIEGRTRILLQHLQIDRIPLYEVRYSYAGVDRHLWLCGNEQEVYAPRAPWNRSRLFGTIVTAGLIGMVLIGGLVFLLFFWR